MNVDCGQYVQPGTRDVLDDKFLFGAGGEKGWVEKLLPEDLRKDYILVLDDGWALNKWQRLSVAVQNGIGNARVCNVMLTADQVAVEGSRVPVSPVDGQPEIFRLRLGMSN